MLDQGFMPDIRRTISIPSMPPKKSRQTLMFSATFPPEIQRCAGEFLNNYLYLQVNVVMLFNLYSFICILRNIFIHTYLILFYFRLDLLEGLVQMLCRHSTELPSTRRRTSSSASSMRTVAMPRRGRWCLSRPRGRQTSSALTSVKRYLLGYFMNERPVLNTALQGFPATSIHGDRLQSEREQVIDSLDQSLHR